MLEITINADNAKNNFLDSRLEKEKRRLTESQFNALDKNPIVPRKLKLNSRDKYIKLVLNKAGVAEAGSMHWADDPAVPREPRGFKPFTESESPAASVKKRIVNKSGNFPPKLTFLSFL